MSRFLLIGALLGMVVIATAQSSGTLESFPLNEVRLTAGPFQDAQLTDLNYILALDPDRLLAPFLEDAGLVPLEPHYGNWEGSGLNGHMGGHYLSALSMMYAATGNMEIKDRLDYMISQIARCQQKNGNGYVAGIPDGKRIWKEISEGTIHSDYFSLNGGWVPLYNIHKLFAGLRDTYLFAGNEEALQIWTALSDWWMLMLHQVKEAQVQQMLKSEHGGLNEVFADLYEVTGQQQYLDMAEELSHRVLLNPLLEQRDSLTGMHANTQIPKVIGYEKISEVGGSADWTQAARFFWETVVDHRTISIGGNSVREHFHSADDFTAMVTSEQGPETCNTYNMLRLSKMLFLATSDPKYLEYYERAQYNHILSSQHPDGGFVYFTPARPRHYRVYSQPDLAMWCCVGSGLENHTKYGELIYAHQGNDLWVNLYIPSVLDWKETGIRLEQQNQFPTLPKSTLKMHMEHAASFALKLREPRWSTSGISVRVNGHQVKTVSENGYLAISRKWKDGDEVTLDLPMEMRMEYLPDGSNWASFVYGPVVMAAATDTTDLDGLFADDSRMGHVASGRFYPANEAPMLVGTDEIILAGLKRTDSDNLHFQLNDAVFKQADGPLLLQPFYEIHEARYMLYWPVTDSAGLHAKRGEMEKQERERLALQAITVDYVAPGEQQPESDHGFRGENTHMGYSKERYWRAGRGWFAYDLKNPAELAKFIRVGYECTGDHAFQLLLNDELLVEEQMTLADGEPQKTYALPAGAGTNLTVKFQALPGSSLPHVLEVRLLSEP